MADLEVSTAQLTQVMDRISRLAFGRASERRGLLSKLATRIKEQSEYRIQVDKTSPRGTPWKPWSASYARTRKAHHSLLRDTDAMLDTIKTRVQGTVAKIWSPKGYSGYVQLKRPWLGISDRDRRELQDIVDDWVRSKTNAD